MTDSRPAVGREQLERATALVTTLLRGHRLGKHLPVAAAAVGRALVTTSPKSDHGQLLFRALQDPGIGQRPASEQAILWLARRGETPTAAAVATRLEGQARRQAARERFRTALDHAVDQDGPAAARHVAVVVAETGTGPTWRELGDALDWPFKPYDVRFAIITRLIAAGWLDQGDKTFRSLRPGRRHANKKLLHITRQGSS